MVSSSDGKDILYGDTCSIGISNSPDRLLYLYANGRKWKRNHFYSRIGSDAIDGRTAAVGTSVCHSPTYTASGTGNK